MAIQGKLNLSMNLLIEGITRKFPRFHSIYNHSLEKRISAIKHDISNGSA